MKRTILPTDMDTLARIAGIIPSGAAAQALAEHRKRTAAGEDVRIYEVRQGRESTLIVGPEITDEAA